MFGHIYTLSYRYPRILQYYLASYPGYITFYPWTHDLAPDCQTFRVQLVYLLNLNATWRFLLSRDTPPIYVSSLQGYFWTCTTVSAGPLVTRLIPIKSYLSSNSWQWFQSFFPFVSLSIRLCIHFNLYLPFCFHSFKLLSRFCFILLLSGSLCSQYKQNPVPLVLFLSLQQLISISVLLLI